MKSISIWFCIYFVYSKDDLTPYLTNSHLTDILPLHYPALGILLGHDRWAEPTSVSPVHTDIHLVTNTVVYHEVFICYHIHQYLVLPHITVSSNTYILSYIPLSSVILYQYLLMPYLAALIVTLIPIYCYLISSTESVAGKTIFSSSKFSSSVSKSLNSRSTLYSKMKTLCQKTV